MLQQLHFNLGRLPFACALDDNGFPPFLKQLRIQMHRSCESEPKQHGYSRKASQFQGSPPFLRQCSWDHGSALDHSLPLSVSLITIRFNQHHLIRKVSPF